MSRITMLPSSVKSGARTARTLASEVEASAGRLKGLPMPPGLKTDVAGQLAGISASLGRVDDSLQSQGEWLWYRATMGLAADAPSGFPIDLTGPRLLSPHAPKPRRTERPSYLDGIGAGLKDLGEGALRTGALANQFNPFFHLLPASVVPLKKTQERYNREFFDGMKWGYHHPEDFTKAALGDVVAYEDHAKGNHAFGAGKNTVSAGELLFPVSKIAKAAKSTRVASRAARTETAATQLRNAARLTEDLAISRRRFYDSDVERLPNESDADFGVRKSLHELRRDTAKRNWRASKIAAHEASRALQESKRKAEESAAAAAQARQALRDQVKDNVREQVTQPIDLNTTHEAFEAHRDDVEEERRNRAASSR